MGTFGADIYIYIPQSTQKVHAEPTPNKMLDLFLALKKWGETSRGWKSNFIMAVDGSEIRLSPVEIGSLSHYLHGFYTSNQWLGMGFLNHQQ